MLLETITHFNLKNPKDGAFIQYKNTRFVTIYNSIIDSYGIYIVQNNFSDLYWNPPTEYIYPKINWEKIWKEMDYCMYGKLRHYQFSISINGPEIQFYNYKL